MQRYTTFFITVNSLHVSGGFSAHHQELKNCTHSIWYMSSLLAATVSVGALANALYVSGGFSAHHQDLKNCKHNIWYMPSLLAATVSVGALVNALHVSAGFSAHHQKLKNCTHSIWYMSSLLLLLLAWVRWPVLYMFQEVSPSIIRSSKLYTPHLVYVKLAVCTVFELLMMGGETV